MFYFVNKGFNEETISTVKAAAQQFSLLCSCFSTLLPLFSLLFPQHFLHQDSQRVKMEAAAAGHMSDMHACDARAYTYAHTCRHV